MINHSEKFISRHLSLWVLPSSTEMQLLREWPTIGRRNRVAIYRNRKNTNCQTKPRARLADESESQGCIGPISGAM